MGDGETKTKKRTSRAPSPAVAGLREGGRGSEVEAAQDYLIRFGYLAPESSRRDVVGPVDGSVDGPVDASPVARAGEFDGDMVAAVQAFQRMAGLPVTGEIDEATAVKMAQPRCGNPDQVSRFVATGGRWPTTNLIYAFREFTGDVGAAACRQAVHQAFSTWAGWTGLTFREGPIGSAHIILRFVTGDHQDGFPFDGGSGVLAHAFFPPVPPSAPVPIQGDTHFDDAEVWTIAVPPGAGQFDLTTVAIHEFGHALGLNHSPVTGACMEAFYAGPRRVLHSDDVSGITSIYGSYSIAEASWIHGTSVQIEVPDSLELVRRMGFFTRVVGRPGTTNWFHFALPTPVIVDNVRKTFGPCMLRFATGGPNALVRDVHLYDGEMRVVAHDGVNLWGSQPFTRFGVAHAPKLRWGVGISIGVTFGAGTAAQRTIDFISAGCDFQP